MPDCHKCHQPVNFHSIKCPHCGIVLKAHGHPGMPLFQAIGNEFLCLSCLYHKDDTCNFPKRPHAKDCTLYRDHPQSTPSQPLIHPTKFQLQIWVKRNLSWILLAGLLLISLLLAVLK